MSCVCCRINGEAGFSGRTTGQSASTWSRRLSCSQAHNARRGQHDQRIAVYAALPKEKKVVIVGAGKTALLQAAFASACRASHHRFLCSLSILTCTPKYLRNETASNCLRPLALKAVLSLPLVRFSQHISPAQLNGAHYCLTLFPTACALQAAQSLHRPGGLELWSAPATYRHPVYCPRSFRWSGGPSAYG